MTLRGRNGLLVPEGEVVGGEVDEGGGNEDEAENSRSNDSGPYQKDDGEGSGELIIK